MKTTAAILLFVFATGCKAAVPAQTDAVKAELDTLCHCTKIHQYKSAKQIKTYTLVCDSGAKNVFNYFLHKPKTK